MNPRQQDKLGKLLSDIREILGLKDFALKSVREPLNMHGDSFLHGLVAKNAPPSLIAEALNLPGADINALNSKGEPVLQTAIEIAHPETIRLLIDKGAAVYFPLGGEDGYFNAMQAAVTVGRLKAVEAVLDSGGGLYVNEKGSRQNRKNDALAGCRALHLALRRGHNDMIPLLLQAGASPEIADGTPEMPALHWLAENDNDYRGKTLRMLIDAGADVDHCGGPHHWTALHQAINMEKYYNVKTLLEAGANPNIECAPGVTPLILCAGTRNMQIVDLLLEAGADPDLASSYNGKTPLMAAVERGNSPFAEKLLAAGANPSLTDAYNKSAKAYSNHPQSSHAKNMLEAAEEKMERAYFENAYKKYKPPKGRKP